MIDNQQLAYWLALNHLHGFGIQAMQALQQFLPTLNDIFKASTQELISYGLSANLANKLQRPDWGLIEKELQWADQDNQHIVPYDDVNYPCLLREISSAPLVLFVKGNVNYLSMPQLALVGSRNPTHNGKEIAQRFAHFLSEAGFIITSGLALGIDTASHQGALKKGATIAVLGAGLDRIYPASNQKLAEQITENGALVSEFTLNTSIKAENFPRRNRLISGLSLGVVVVEAALKSGSLITARYATEQGREVFAIPGSIHNPLSRGCHKLIREGAKLVERVEDILEELGPLCSLFSTVAKENISFTSEKLDFNSLEKDYRILLSCVNHEPTAIDTIITRSGLSPAVVSSMLLQLELQGFVGSVLGGYCKNY